MSRFSIPLDTGAQDISLDLYLAFEATDQICIVGMNRHKLGNRFPVFGDQNAVRIDAIKKRYTLLLEFGCGHSFHEPTVEQSA